MRPSQGMDDIAGIWSLAGRFDPGLSGAAARLKQLAPLRIPARSWSRTRLFQAAASGQAFVARGLAVPVADSGAVGMEPTLVRLLTRAFGGRGGEGHQLQAQVGPSRSRRRMAVAELLRRWGSGRHIVSVTDLHIRGTRLERQIDTTALSAFNLLLFGSEDLRRQEMMTMVISSRGNVTDSHSDDPDGSNHCFVGRKLWLAWDTFEGRRAGLQDCSRDLVSEGADFDLSRFARLRSACWWTVEPGQTLFLPGRLTHRVITLDPYMGIGSFYCTPASILENLSRWYVHGALWALGDPGGENAGLVDEVADLFLQRLSALAAQAPRVRHAWGLGLAQAAVTGWESRVPPAERRQAAAVPRFAKVHHALAALA